MMRQAGDGILVSRKSVSIIRNYVVKRKGSLPARRRPAGGLCRILQVEVNRYCFWS
jgi:hypothetical protein